MVLLRCGARGGGSMHECRVLTAWDAHNMIHVIFIRAMARIANTRKEETHERIVQAAARAIRRHGYAGVGVADVMKEAGLTHGGFYAHFKSRDELLVEALARAGSDSSANIARAAEARRARGVSAFRAFVDSYLSDAHLQSMESGCPVAALGSDMARQ